MLSKEIPPIYSENYMRPIHTLSGQNAQLLTVKADGFWGVKHRGQHNFYFYNILYDELFQEEWGSKWASREVTVLLGRRVTAKQAVRFDTRPTILILCEQS
jgi:hypothetical protein